MKYYIFGNCVPSNFSSHCLILKFFYISHAVTFSYPSLFAFGVYLKPLIVLPFFCFYTFILSSFIHLLKHFSCDPFLSCYKQPISYFALPYHIITQLYNLFTSYLFWHKSPSHLFPVLLFLRVCRSLSFLFPRATLFNVMCTSATTMALWSEFVSAPGYFLLLQTIRLSLMKQKHNLFVTSIHLFDVHVYGTSPWFINVSFIYGFQVMY